MGLRIRISFIVSLLLALEVHAQTTHQWLIRENSTWHFHGAKKLPPKTWNQFEFDDRKWKTGKAGFGYGDADDQTHLRDMEGNYDSVFIRKTFQIDKVSAHKKLQLYVDYDDGFIAYLNGTKVASASVIKAKVGPPQVNLHEAGQMEMFAIKNANRILKRGKNVLAIVGYNADLNSSDFSLHPALVVAKPLDVNDMLSDIDELEARILDQSSYLTRRGFDHKQAFADLRTKVKQSPDIKTFMNETQKLVMQIGDCHAGVSSSHRWYGDQYLPFRLADTDKGLAVLSLNSNRPLDKDCPYLVSINNIEIQKWLDAASRFVAKGSPQLIRNRSLDWVTKLDLMRSELNLPPIDRVTIQLRSADGKQKKELTRRPTRQATYQARVYLNSQARVVDNIGYIRIPQMSNRLVEPIVQIIKQMSDTDGLILDVRDNGGGTYRILRGIYGFFVPEDAAPRITNIAAFRLSPRFQPNHIAYRPTYRADWKGWNQVERTAIRKAAAQFKPEWQPPANKFSDWHYMLLSRNRSGRTVNRGKPDDYFHYKKPIVVLCNAASFSATDGFLSAFASLPQATLVGQPSGGGSGATRRFELSKTRTRIALSSMASFQANGKTFDGNGVPVDLSKKPTLEDFTSRQSDSVLKFALERLKRKQN